MAHRAAHAAVSSPVDWSHDVDAASTCVLSTTTVCVFSVCSLCVLCVFSVCSVSTACVCLSCLRLSAYTTQAARICDMGNFTGSGLLLSHFMTASQEAETHQPVIRLQAVRSPVTVVGN